MAACDFKGRVEDQRLVRGQGTYSADFNLPGQLYGAFLRSPMAHAELRSVDIDGALAMDGVRAVLIGADLKELGFGKAAVVPGQMHADGRPMLVPDWPPLVIDRVRYLGESIALVVATSAALAQDATEAIVCDLVELPASVQTEYGASPESPVWPHAPDNLALDYAAGDRAAADAAFAAAAHVTKAHIVSQRLIVNPMEPRAAIAHYDCDADRYDLHAGSQGAAGLRAQAALLMGLPVDKVRVVSRDVGGGFGAKTHVYPEYAALLAASRRVGAPVKWVSTRSEGFVSDTQGRDTIIEGELALDAKGKFTALRVRSVVNIGAYQSSHSTMTATSNVFRCAASVYTTPVIDIAIQCIYSNTVPVAPYRGAGRPEANLIIEHLIERAAAELGIDPIKLRQRNMIAPRAMPYRAPNGMIYDSGDFPRALARALELADHAGFAKRRRAAGRQGLLRGIGVACYLEIAGGTPFEDMRFDVDAEGVIEMRSGLQSNGQGHATVFPQLVAERLGLRPEQVRLVEGDSSLVPEGVGSVGSRSMTVGGAAAIITCEAFVERVRGVAAEMLQASVERIVYAQGKVCHPDTGQSLSFADIVGQGHALSVTARGRADLTFPNGCHVAEIEIDPITGIARFIQLVAVDDVGNCISPVMVEGQVHGGIAQALGQVLIEHAIYEDMTGQLLTGSFMDYAMPRADDLPPYTAEHLEVPAATNPLGTKGAGEAGTTGALAAGYNALRDALAQAGVRSFDMPATPSRVWAALQEAAQA
jgi:carbon-monoxide dehydrogenase large subunit